MDSLSGLIRLTERDIARASEVLARAFILDPMVTYIFSQEKEAERNLSLLFEVMVRYGLRYGEVYAPSGNIEGIAIWLTSENSEMSMPKMLECGFGDFSSQVSPEYVERLIYFNDFAFEKNKKYAPFRHWYLAFIGVDPDFHGKGFASALIKPMLARISKEKMSCYLETTIIKNAAMYEHFGFELKEEAIIPDTDVMLFAMLKEK
ncbi:MAG: GNAT family N-acetyltransferase [Candidatus Omnitrophica bacterium]|nr:GNAT family N-acetyltransferase [Candidatus Omnitrophota bacterium]